MWSWTLYCLTWLGINPVLLQSSTLVLHVRVISKSFCIAQRRSGLAKLDKHSAKAASRISPCEISVASSSRRLTKSKELKNSDVLHQQGGITEACILMLVIYFKAYTLLSDFFFLISTKSSANLTIFEKGKKQLTAVGCLHT